MTDTTGKSDDGKLLYCSFCGKSQHEVRKLIAGPSVFICDECVDLCNDIIREEVQEDSSETGGERLPKPNEIKDTLDEYVIGQERAKKLSISTFHSFCLQIIRTYPKKIGVEKGFTLVGTSDQLDLVRRALEEKGWNGLYKTDEILYQIGICKKHKVDSFSIKNFAFWGHCSSFSS